jgi:hypothetical protein
MRAVGPAVSRSFQTTGAESPRFARQRAITLFVPGRRETSARNEEPFRATGTCVGRPFTRRLTGPQRDRPRTPSVQAKASPPLVVNLTGAGDGLGDGDSEGAGEDDGEPPGEWPRARCDVEADVQAPAIRASATDATTARRPTSPLGPRERDAADELFLEDEEHDDER